MYIEGLSSFRTQTMVDEQKQTKKVYNISGFPIGRVLSAVLEGLPVVS